MRLPMERSWNQSRPGAAPRIVAVAATVLLMPIWSALPAAPAQDRAGAPRFAGLASALAGDNFVLLSWNAAVDDADPPAALRYRVYLAGRSEEQDFSKPHLETSAGALSARVGPLPPLRPVYVVVRAVDGSGNEDENRIEWTACPNPVVYVSAASTGKDPDGRTPATAHGSLERAIGSAIAMDGVNFWVAGGRYPSRLVLFPGMMIYGGFPADFDETRRDPAAHPTVIEANAAADLVVLGPGDLPQGLDGMRLDGKGIGERGIVGKECEVFLARVEVHGFKRMGIRLGKPDDDSRVEGALRGLEVHRNGSEGIQVAGSLDLRIAGSTVHDNVNEGIAGEGLYATATRKSTLIIEDCRIAENQDIGVDIDLVAGEKPASEGSKVRVSLRRNQVERNKDHGLSVDISGREAPASELRVQVEGCRFAGNESAGIQLDADVDGDYVLSENVVVENGGAGILLTGHAPTSVYSIGRSTVARNRGPGVAMRWGGTILIEGSSIDANGGVPIEAPHGFTQVMTSDGGAAPAAATLGLVGLDPPPGGFLGEPRWQLRFASEPAAQPSIRLSVGAEGAAQAPVKALLEGRTLVAAATESWQPGTRLVLELPYPSDTAVGSPALWRFEYTVAAPLPPAGGTIERFPASGTASFRGGVREHRYIVVPARAGALRVEVGARRRGAKGTWRLELRNPGGSAVVAESDGVDALGGDPRLELSPVRAGEPLELRVSASGEEIDGFEPLYTLTLTD